MDAAQVIVLAVFAGLASGMAVSIGVWSALRDRRKPLPYLPTHEDKLDGEPDAATRFLAATHDVVMLTVEARNRRLAGQDPPPMEELLVQGGIDEAVGAMEARAEALRRALGPLFATRTDLVLARSALKKAFDYRSEEVWGPPPPWVQTPGDVLQSVTHTYTFEPDQLSKAREHLERAAARSETTFQPNLAARRLRLADLDAADQLFLQRVSTDRGVRDLGAALHGWLHGSDLERMIGDAKDAKERLLRGPWHRPLDDVAEHGETVQFSSSGAKHASPAAQRQLAALVHAIDTALTSLNALEDWLKGSVTQARALRELTAQRGLDHELAQQHAAALHRHALPEAPLQLRSPTLPSSASLISGSAGLLTGLIVGIVLVLILLG